MTKNMDKKEKKVLTKLFADEDLELLSILLDKCIITIRPEDKKENANDNQELVAM
jgi:hypothetical protein